MMYATYTKIKQNTILFLMYLDNSRMDSPTILFFEYFGLIG